MSLNPGRRIRYDRLVRPETGHTIMVPLDHGMIYGPMRGIEDPAAMVRNVVAGGVDGVIFSRAGQAATERRAPAAAGLSIS